MKTMIQPSGGCWGFFTSVFIGVVGVRTTLSMSKKIWEQANRHPFQGALLEEGQKNRAEDGGKCEVRKWFFRC